MLSESVTNMPPKQINAEIVQGKCRTLQRKCRFLQSVCSVAEKMDSWNSKSTPLPSSYLFFPSIAPCFFVLFVCFAYCMFSELRFDYIFIQLIRKRDLIVSHEMETTSSLHLAF